MFLHIGFVVSLASCPRPLRLDFSSLVPGTASKRQSLGHSVGMRKQRGKDVKQQIMALKEHVTAACAFIMFLFNVFLIERCDREIHFQAMLISFFQHGACRKLVLSLQIF